MGAGAIAVSPSRRPPWLLITLALLTSLVMAVPIGYLVYYALSMTDDVEPLWSGPMRIRWWNTLLLMAAVTTTVAGLGIVASWLTVRTNLWGRRLLAVLLVCPLAVPPYVTAYSLLGLGGDDGLLVRLLGADSSLLRFWFVDAQTGRFHVPRLGGYLGSWLALSAYNFPYVYLPLRAAWHAIDASQEEAASSLGRSRAAVAVWVVGPQLLPALLAGMLLVALHVMADFGVVSLMRYETLSTTLYARYNSFDTGNAARLALVMISFALLLLMGEWLLLKRLRLDRAGVGTARIARRTDLGIWQFPALFTCCLVVVMGVILPVVTTGYWMSTLSDPTIWTSIRKALWGSVVASLPAAVGASILAIPIALLSVRYPGRLTAIFERAPLVGYSVPALALGLSFIMLCLAPWMPELIFETFYQSLPLLVLAYILHFLAEAVGPIRSSLRLTSPRLEEAAWSLGASPWGAVFRVTLPIMRHGILVAAAFVFLSCMKELPLTILLAPVGMETLARNAWDHAENAEFARAAPYALITLCASAGFVGLLLFERRHES